MRFALAAVIFLLYTAKFTYPLDNEDEDFDEEVEFTERMDQLKEICSAEGFIWLNKFYFDDYVKWSSRNYSFLLLFVALADEQRCATCKVAVDEFAILAKSFRQADGLSEQLFLGVVDYDQTPEIFYRLRVRSIPSVVLVAADHKFGSGQAVPQMDVQRLGFSAEAISEWLAARTNWRFRIVRPPDSKRLYASVGAVFTAGLLLLAAWKLRNRITSFWSSNLMRLTAIVFCLLMVSGHMFNRIHQPPLFHMSERGISLISQDSAFQFVYETYLICAMYLGFTGCVIVMVDGGVGKNSMRSTSVYASLLLATLCYSFIVSSLRFKVDVYPFSGLVNVESYF